MNLSPAKSAALAALHAARRGVRQHPEPPDLPRLLAQIQEITRRAIRGGSVGPDPRSRRELARHLGISDRTIRRWLSGEDVPPPAHIRALRKWVRDQRKV
jgi:transcriptional regulator with XRE-family HTH domain